MARINSAASGFFFCGMIEEPVFDATDTLALCVAATTGMIADADFRTDAMKAAAGRGFTTATDLADWLVRVLAMPFRDAHHVTGALVALAEKKGCDLADLPLAEMQGVNGEITAGVFDVLTVEASVASRQSYGGTAPVRVREQIARWRGLLG